MADSRPRELRTAYRTCPLCEATCGLELAVDDATGRVVRVRGDREDVFSGGYLCPKGASLGALSADPDRLRQPLVRHDGEFEVASWDDALTTAAQRLSQVGDQYGPTSIGLLTGNPLGSKFDALLTLPTLVKALRQPPVFTVSTVDQMPKMVAAALMYGGAELMPVPDIDRIHTLVVVGGNPAVSNGSVMTAPGVEERLRLIRERGGKLIVVDPRRTKTARLADIHLQVRPGFDAFVLLALVHCLDRDGAVRLGRLSPLVRSLDSVLEIAREFPPERIAVASGLEPDQIEALAFEIASSPAAAVYGRMGTSTAGFGTTVSWLLEIVNILTGNLDRPGGSMWPTPAVPLGGVGRSRRPSREAKLGRWHSSVRGLPEVFGELPLACLAEEIEARSVRALVVAASNPVLSAPNSLAVDAALRRLDALVVIDPYLNETSRHADVILPPLGPLHHSHYDMSYYQYAVRNVANFSPAVMPPPADGLLEWEIYAHLATRLRGQPEKTPDDVLAEAAEHLIPIAAREADVDEDVARRSTEHHRGPDRLLDLRMRCGPHGDNFGNRPEGLSIDRLIARPHGIDLGPLEPRLPDVLRTADGLIDLAPAQIVSTVPQLASLLEETQPELVLIGRRDLRSKNSWLHNVRTLAKGSSRARLEIHPTDAQRCGVVDRGAAVVRSAAGQVHVEIEVTEDVMPGVVCLPHGWGHERDGTRQGIAAREDTPNSNRLTDESNVDVLSGTCTLNGIPVEVSPKR